MDRSSKILLQHTTTSQRESEGIDLTYQITPVLSSVFTIDCVLTNESWIFCLHTVLMI